MLLTLSLALILGFWNFVDSVRARHQQNLEQALIRFVLINKLDEVRDLEALDFFGDDPINDFCLVRGTPDNFEYVASSYLDGIQLKHLKRPPAKNGSVFYVGDIAWAGGGIVSLNYGMVRSGECWKRVEGAQFQLVGEDWVCVFEGEKMFGDLKQPTGQKDVW